jgi:hypothetical protein
MGDATVQSLRPRYGPVREIRTTIGSFSAVVPASPRLSRRQAADAQDVHAEAERRGVRIAAPPTAEACRLRADVKSEEVYVVLHVTC